jgi:predicted molibdopterin-dependent oxidoreductase YjgC
MCPKNERCELKDTVRYVGVDMDSPLAYNYRNLQVDVGDPFYDRDYNLCIACARCVRACDEVRGDSAITMIERSGTVLVGTSFGTSLLESGCEFCGACIDVCPVGALVETENKWEKAQSIVSSVCTLCPVGCEMDIEVDTRGRAIRYIGKSDGVNDGQLCYKGKFNTEMVNSRKRLNSPLIRREGALEEATWDEALEVISASLSQHRGSAFGALAGNSVTNESLYLLQKFARIGMGSNNVDYIANHRSKVLDELGRIIGIKGASGSYKNVRNSEAILLVSSNITEEQNVAAVPLKQAVKSGTRLVVVDSREVEMTRYAEIWLRPYPGTEMGVLGAMLRVISDESLENHGFLTDSCDGLAEYKSSLWAFDLKKVSKISGVSEESIRTAARVIATQGKTSILYALDNIAIQSQDEMVAALANLAMVTGSLGSSAGGVFPLLAGANQQGASDIGCEPAILQGNSTMVDADHKDLIERIWESTLPSASGLGTTSMIDDVAAGGIRAMMVVGYDDSLVNGDIPKALEALAKLEFLVVQDVHRNEITELADVVLPSVPFTEDIGTMTTQDRRVQMITPAIAPRGECLSDWQIIGLIANAMGSSENFTYQNSSQIFHEIQKIVPTYANIKYETISTGQSVQWPCDTDGKGTPTLYTNGFSSSHLLLRSMEFKEQVTMATSDEYPLIIVPGRVLYQDDRESELTKQGLNNVLRRTEVADIHPDDAVVYKLRQGDEIEISDAKGWYKRVGVNINGSVAPGTVSVTTLFGEMATQLQSSKNPLKMLKAPRLNVVPVRLDPVTVSVS